MPVNIASRQFQALYAICCCAVAGALAACGEAQPLITQRAISTSSVSPSAKHQDLLYAGDQLFSEVYVFSYPALERVGTLSGFSLPEGLCSDNKGNVFVTDLLARRIVEYAHGASEPVKTLNENGNPQGCSVDPATGDLAVANYGSSGSPGRIAIFHRAHGKPAIYRDSSIASFSSCTYDSRGDLFAVGLNYDNHAGLVELYAGADQLTALQFNRSFDGVSSVQWDGRHVVVMGDSPRIILRLATSGTEVRVVGRTELRSPKYSFSFWIAGTTIILTYVPPHTRVKYTSVGLWKYPGGGKPTRSVRQLLDTYGVTVSALPKT